MQLVEMLRHGVLSARTAQHLVWVRLPLLQPTSKSLSQK